MIQLKDYQEEVIEEFGDYLDRIFSNNEMYAYQTVFNEMQRIKGSNSTYVTNNSEVPSVCIQIPTGGGKTIVACHLLCSLYEKYLKYKGDVGTVLWMVPSKTIQEQTLTALRDQNHPYRKILDDYFKKGVLIFNSDEMQKIQPHEIADNLCIIVTTFSMFRVNDLGNRNVYEDNGTLISHFQNITPDQRSLIRTNFDGNEIGRESLVNVLRMDRPVIIADESHNAQTKLTIDMYENLNPCFHLEYTASPNPHGERHSNIITSISAHRLKNEGMVKMPMYLYEKSSWKETIRAAHEKRNMLEGMAYDEYGISNEYIRPILLIQAEYDKPNNHGIGVREVIDFLEQELKIPTEYIRTKTNTINDLEENSILLSNKSKVRYIVTVKALSEGWDNAFAYVLATLSTLGSETARIQILGRIIRLPNQIRKQNSELNNSYVYATTHNFRNVSSSIENELIINGYQRNDIRRPEIDEKINLEDCRMIHDKSDCIQLPCIGMNKDEQHKISFRSDLLGDGFSLEDKDIPTDLVFFVDAAKTIRFDINEKGDYNRRFVQENSNLVGKNIDFDREAILEYLDKKIKRINYTQHDKRAYLAKVIDHELGDINDEGYGERTGRLALACQQLSELMDKKINDIEVHYAKKKFYQFKNEELLNVIYETLPNTIQSFDKAHEEFKNHLYEWAETMNDEEYKLAERIDNMKNIVWWFRNREKNDFYIQGWEDRRFYPDFIIKTKSKKYVVVEYKGQYLCNNEDSKYKRELGNAWSELAGTNYIFEFVCTNDVNEFLLNLEKL